LQRSSAKEQDGDETMSRAESLLRCIARYFGGNSMVS